jgi:hypothetical protein
MLNKCTHSMGRTLGMIVLEVIVKCITKLKFDALSATQARLPKHLLLSLTPVLRIFGCLRPAAHQLPAGCIGDMMPPSPRHSRRTEPNLRFVMVLGPLKASFRTKSLGLVIFRSPIKTLVSRSRSPVLPLPWAALTAFLGLDTIVFRFRALFPPFTT